MKGIPIANEFVGRTLEIHQIEESLLPRDEDSGRKFVVLHGLGGIGKTQLAVKFARKNQRQYDSVFWLDGRTEQSLKNSLTEVGKRLPQGQVPESVRTFTIGSSGELDTVIKHVLDWFNCQGNTKWLLIFDNVDDPDAYDIIKFMPDADHGSILITTRRRSFAHYGKDIQVTTVSQDEARSILSNTSGRTLQGNCC